jgi:tripartite ATP-independent transporter DctM subunit
MIAALISIFALCALLILRVPMLFSIIFSVILNFLLTSAWQDALPQLAISGMSRFVLISFPLFILAGGLMHAGGISGRLFEFARSLVGWMRGGLGHVNVLTCMFFGGMVGSSVAELAGTGSIMIPVMKENGYPNDFSAALTASASGLGPIIPPSNPMILYSAITGTSLGALFFAGIIPGILLGLGQMMVVAYLARKKGWRPYAPFRVAEVIRTGWRASLSFGLPLIILGGLVLGVFTPTEAGAFAAVYSVTLACIIYRELSLRDLYRVTVNAVQLTGEILLIVSMSFALGWGLSNARVPEMLVSLVNFFVIGDSQYLRIMALLLIAILAGFILDPLIPVVLPILLPTLLIFHIDLLHFGILMVLSVVIGQVTPPMAMALIISGRIAEVDQIQVFKANTPFLILILVFLMLVAAVPQIATWLPRLLMH